ncbi:hypothetical protein RND81_08G020800 [Saponaria officinalis]|uniref:Uncharacterized protein n=1 Tax=Saponaria officinalis TaxID=3572 RepID=A0AAW1J286_SAPOF
MDNGRKTHWLSWKKLCMPKKFGGLGFRDFKCFNWALLGKQAWRLYINEETIATRVIKGKYFPDSSFMEAELGHNPSYTWRGLWEARDVLRTKLRKQIGNGAATRIWSEAWIPDLPNGKIISTRPTNFTDTLVKDWMIENEYKWDEAKVRQWLLPFEADCVLNIRLSPRHCSD